MPIAVETLSAPGDEAHAFFRDLGQHITTKSSELHLFQLLMQPVSVVVQRALSVRSLRRLTGMTLFYLHNVDIVIIIVIVVVVIMLLLL